MTTKKEKRQIESIEQMASKYREIMLEVKELEKKADPFKKAILEHAKSIGVASINLGCLSIEKRTSLKYQIDEDRITPDWLYRLQSSGFADVLSISLDNKIIKNKKQDDALCELLNEVDFQEKETFNYAIRI